MDTKKMLVGRVSIGISMRIEWYRDFNDPARFGDAVKFDHHFQNIIQMLNDIVSIDLIEVIVDKWIWIVVQIMQDIGIRTGIHIDANGTGPFTSSAADIKNNFLFVIQFAAFC